MPRCFPVIESVCASQHFILGEHVRAFEAEVARYCGASAGIGVSSGTDALLLALMAFGIGAGDEVITSPFTFFATAGTIARTGARPVFCDIDPETFNLSAAAVESFIERQCRVDQGVLVNRWTGGRIRALMPVHLYGQSADMDALVRIARAYGLRIIEDAAQAIGTEYTDGTRVGSIGDIGCFSFFPSKNLGAFGDAGLCTTNDPDLAEHMRVLRVHGGKPKYFHAFIGGNFRIDELQAAILRVKLKHLDAWTEARQRNAAYYSAAFERAGLAPRIVTPRARRGRPPHLQSVRASAPSAATSCAPRSPSGGSAPRSTIPCRCICSNVLPHLGYAAGRLPAFRARRRRDAGAADLSGAHRGPARRRWSRPSREFYG